MRLYRSTANFTKVEKIAIQWIALSGLRTTDPSSLTYISINFINYSLPKCWLTRFQNSIEWLSACSNFRTHFH